MQEDALNNYQRGAAYWKLGFLPQVSWQTAGLDPVAGGSTAW